MNSVHLIGNLATDVELRDVGEEKKVANFLLAIDRGSKDGGADFVWISAWDRQAELCAQYLDKGNRVAVDGRRTKTVRRLTDILRPLTDEDQRDANGETGERCQQPPTHAPGTAHLDESIEQRRRHEAADGAGGVQHG